MPNLYARQTALSSVTGRIDYISNPSRQEHLLASYDGAAGLCDGNYWQLLAAECNEQQKYTGDGKKVVQGRELVIPLSNALTERMTPEEICKTLADEFDARYNRPCIVALHYNKAKNNLHAHLIYSERELLKEPQIKIAPRNLFFDEQGKRHYKKSEIIDPDTKQLRAGCYVVKKGEAYERHYFSAVDPQFADKRWYKDMKSNWLLPLRNGKLKGDVEITEYDLKSGKLPQLHIGTVQRIDTPEAKAITKQIEAYNQSVKEWNALVDKGAIPPAEAQKVQAEIRKAPIKGTLLPEAIERIKKLIDDVIKAVKEKLRNRPKAKEIAGKIKTVRKQQQKTKSEAAAAWDSAEHTILGIGKRKKVAVAKALDDKLDVLAGTEEKLKDAYAQETGLTRKNIATLTKQERTAVMCRLSPELLQSMAKASYPPITVIDNYPAAQRQATYADIAASAEAAQKLRQMRLMPQEKKVQAEELLEEKAEQQAAQMRREVRKSQIDKLHEYQTKVKSRGNRQEPQRDEWGER